MAKKKRVNIDVLPLKNKNFEQQFYLVLLRENNSKPTQLKGAKRLSENERADKDQQLEELREELESGKQSLQTVIEEQEGTNEELHAAMEEVQSSNEELQSTNEELETAKEELQSTNEELKTLNEELKTRNDELARLNDDLSNIIKNTDVAMVIVDFGLRIRRLTPLAEEVLGLIPTDVKRPITNIRLAIPVKDLERTILEVTSRLNIVRSNMQDQKGRWYELRIRHYITEEKKVDGAVISFIDINDLKRVQDKILVEAEKYRTLTENAPEVIARFDSDHQFIYVSPSAQKAINIDPASTLGKRIEQIEALKPVAKQLTEALTNAFNTKKILAGEFTLETSSDFKAFKFTIAPEIVNNQAISAVSVITDITELKKMERRLKEHLEHLAEIIKQKTAELKNAERFAGIGETAGMIGHDIRNPLQAFAHTTNRRGLSLRGVGSMV
jgi:two-component system, chemotaxis family, CheB/CheR fusion protein